MRAWTGTLYRRWAWRSVLRATASGIVALLLVAAAAVATQSTPPPANDAAQGDFAGLVDISGGRRMYLECRGSGGPTVILVAGYGNHGGVWSIESPAVPQPQVLPAVARFTRVCAYDRPGTIVDPDDPTDRSRSDPVPQPRAAQETVADLHTLLHAAGVPGPYVLVGHSFGGLFVRLYAATYPDEAAGMVLVDALSEGFRAAVTPEQWAVALGIFQFVLPQLASYRDYERADFDAAFDAMQRASAAQPLRPMPLVVLSAGVILDLSVLGLIPPSGFQETFAAASRANQAYLARLLPDARQVIVPEAGHYIQVEQPQAAIDAIRQVVSAVRAPASRPFPAVGGDFAGLVDVGGRRLYLECHGTGSPTVVLEAGANARADIWSRDLHEPAGSRPMVLPAVAEFTRVCAYDRPGTVGEVNPDLDPLGPPFFPSRSDPVPMPRTARDVVADLHALLQAAGVPGPYVLVGHSFGGMVVRLHAGTYPDQVDGLVLVDATHEDVWVHFRARMTPTQWAEFERLQFNLEPPEEYPDVERIDFDATTAQIRQARVDAPLRPMPLAVLGHGRPFAAPFPDWPGDAMEQIMLAMNYDLATLVPNARLGIASQAGHNIHQEQPALVMEAIRQVVAGVRDRATWYDLATCCTP